MQIDTKDQLDPRHGISSSSTLEPWLLKLHQPRSHHYRNLIHFHGRYDVSRLQFSFFDIEMKTRSVKMTGSIQKFGNLFKRPGHFGQRVVDG